MNKKKCILWLAMAAILLVSIWIIWGNTALECNTYTVSSERIPLAFDGYRIAQVSDLHNAQMGKDNQKLLELLKAAEPDMIAMTGDLIDSRNTNIAVALQFVEKAVKIAPCYYVSGNHEARIPEYTELKEQLTALGVTVLDDRQTELVCGDASVLLAGVMDPSFQTGYLFGDSVTIMQDQLQELGTEETFSILLSHRPELMDVYAEKGIDLVLSGHAHGGQFRLPFVGGLIAPNQGLFPEYDGGRYAKGNTQMIVSRGIGNSIIPLRINNRPELILIQLEAI